METLGNTDEISSWNQYFCSPNDSLFTTQTIDLTRPLTIFASLVRLNLLPSPLSPRWLTIHLAGASTREGSDVTETTAIFTKLGELLQSRSCCAGLKLVLIGPNLYSKSQPPSTSQCEPSSTSQPPRASQCEPSSTSQPPRASQCELPCASQPSITSQCEPSRTSQLPSASQPSSTSQCEPSCTSQCEPSRTSQPPSGSQPSSTCQCEPSSTCQCEPSSTSQPFSTSEPHSFDQPLSMAVPLQIKFVKEFYHLYQSCDDFETPDLIICFNAGVWGFDDWIPTLQKISDNLEAPVVITSYNQQEALDDQDTMEKELPSVHWLWFFKENPFSSLVLLREGDDYPMYENYSWQCIVGKNSPLHSLGRRPD